MSVNIAPNDVELKQLTRQLATALLSANYFLVTAESCTGGWIAKCCTDLAGSSLWFERGMVSYSNQAKQDLLDVDALILEAHGAVSLQTAEAMAGGALLNSQAQIALAVTGIAGPDGGSTEKPVGTVCFGWAAYEDNQLKVYSSLQCFSGNRDVVRRHTVKHAMLGILELLEKFSGFEKK